MAKLVYDGKDAVFGRMATVVAKELLRGNSVDVINCEDVIISGDKSLFAKKILAKRAMGSGSSMKGPQYSRVADRLIKRMIRGMLPWDRKKGQDAYNRLRCYVGNNNFEGEAIKFNHAKPMKFATIKEVMRLLE